ncbi:MAG TPA: ABC transporter permease [Candidatus Limnocylindrales bacterium]|nr:ABC transporter permease [Candidatus Limnocylindrales bacterium]
MSAPAPALRATLAVTAMELRLLSRRGENLLVTIVIPAAVLQFFASVNVLRTPGPAVDFLLPGSIALAVVATSLVNLGIATAYERRYGVLKRLGGSPLPRWGLLGAKVMTIVVVETIQIALLIAIAWFVLGWRPAPNVSPGLAIIALLLGTVAFAGLGLAMAGRLRADATLALANGLFLVFLLLGGIIIPIGELPRELAALASFLPAAPLTELLRMALGMAGDPAPAIVLLASWAGLTTVLAAVTFRWD